MSHVIRMCYMACFLSEDIPADVVRLGILVFICNHAQNVGFCHVVGLIGEGIAVGFVVYIHL